MKRAFTMIELIFVVLILGIIAGVAVPKILSGKTDAEVTRAKDDISAIKSNIQNYAREMMFADLGGKNLGYPKPVVFKNIIGKVNKNWVYDESKSEAKLEIKGVGKFVFIYFYDAAFIDSKKLTGKVSVGDFLCYSPNIECKKYFKNDGVVE